MKKPTLFTDHFSGPLQQSVHFQTQWPPT